MRTDGKSIHNNGVGDGIWLAAGCSLKGRFWVVPTDCMSYVRMGETTCVCAEEADEERCLRQVGEGHTWSKTGGGAYTRNEALDISVG